MTTRTQIIEGLPRRVMCGHISRRLRDTRRGIISRCHYPSSYNYSRYGGRGITVCDRWRESLANFAADMGEPPSPKHSIERINNDKGYSPENCRWATAAEQRRNTRNNVFLTYGGERLCLKDMAAKYGINDQTLAQRLQKGLSVEDALTTPKAHGGIKKGRRLTRLHVTHDGRTMSVVKWSKEVGVHPDTIRRRLQRGMSVAESLSSELWAKNKPEMQIGGRDGR